MTAAGIWLAVCRRAWGRAGQTERSASAPGPASPYAPEEDAMAARLGNVAFDCDDVLKMAAFWSVVLGARVIVGAVTRGRQRRPQSAGTTQPSH